MITPMRLCQASNGVMRMDIDRVKEQGVMTKIKEYYYRPLSEEHQQDAIRLKDIWEQRKEKLLLSQAKAASMMGFKSQGAISQYINGRVPLGVEAALKFCKVLQCNLYEISPRMDALIQHAGYARESKLEG